jgi:hypothetical protein
VLPDTLTPMWDLILVDFQAMVFDDGAEVSTINGCTSYVCELVLLNIGIKCDADAVLSNFAHICPHVLAPLKSSCYGFVFCKRMSDIVGNVGAAHMRCKLVCEMLRLPLTSEVDPLQSLQDYYSAYQLTECLTVVPCRCNEIMCPHRLKHILILGSVHVCTHRRVWLGVWAKLRSKMYTP